ncbi:hypothetical protein ADL26_19135 [Thermoactinomyces vulgaris]|jgi:hypothetical protein|nr:hypothetical protein ADL26_19135 [Thermoactinomyces vulgaris]TCW40410.1 hypothetical protein EDC32_10150 [Laceyella sacchari]
MKKLALKCVCFFLYQLVLFVVGNIIGVYDLDLLGILTISSIVSAIYFVWNYIKYRRLNK